MMKIKHRRKLCRCGCGGFFISGKNSIGIEKRFILGHNNRINPIPIPNHHPCECGCGELVASNRKVVKGHNLFLEETLQKKLLALRLALADKPLSQEHKDKISFANSGEKNGMYGKPGYWTGQKLPEEAIKNMSLAHIGKKLPPMKQEVKDKIGKGNTGKKRTTEMNRKQSEYRKNNPWPDDVKDKSRQKHIQNWQDPEFVKKQYEARLIRPNKPETKILSLLQKLFPNEWRYCGDFSFMIRSKNPDFVNINGQKKVIEHYGTYWHKDDDPDDRINIFAQDGYQTLVIWEHELKNTQRVKAKLINFHRS